MRNYTIRAENNSDGNLMGQLFLSEYTHFTYALNKAGYVNAYIREIFLFYPQGITNELIENPLGMDFTELERERAIWFREEYSEESEIIQKRRIEYYKKSLYESSKLDENVKSFYKRKIKRHKKTNT